MTFGFLNLERELRSWSNGLPGSEENHLASWRYVIRLSGSEHYLDCSLRLAAQLPCDRPTAASSPGIRKRWTQQRDGAPGLRCGLSRRNSPGPELRSAPVDEQSWIRDSAG